MASETHTGVDAEMDRTSWTAGAVGGLAAGVVMGVLLTAMMRPVIAVAIPALYGLEGLAIGWAAHLVHSAIFGVVFAVIATRPAVAPAVDSVGRAVVAGAVYGIGLWVVAAAVVMPVWLGAVGFPNTPPLPNFNPMSLVGHVVYGVVLGAVFAYAR